MQKSNLKNKRGPIADKVIRSAIKHSKSKVVDFHAWKSAKSHQDNLEQFHREKNLSDLEPLHALYTDTQHRIVDFVEQFSELPQSHKLNMNYDEAEDIYMPSGPPMSPLTKSYFTCWALFDMCVGIKRETYTSVMIECCKSFGAHPSFIQVLNHMQESYVGLYLNTGNDKKFVYLKELYTDRDIKVHSTSGYFGVPGELWLTRLLSDPFGNHVDYSISFMTPYIIIDLPPGKKCNNFEEIMYSEKEWIDFIDRSLQKTKYKDQKKAFYYFMKYGLSKHYWPEYVFQAYVNHRADAIWLTGFPDRPKSLPHSDENYRY